MNDFNLRSYKIVLNIKGLSGISKAVRENLTGEYNFFPTHSICKYLISSYQVPVPVLGTKRCISFWAIR